ncbi:F0F1 ATP synthase subunit B, partial [Patescibacteria group bacterium]|nr:F0F1 ATP synthase subunit B [Patescibacteria group bacterium]
MEKLGIEPSLLLAQVVNFLVIMVVLQKLLYKPILTMLEKRKKEIAEGLHLTQKMREEEERLKEKQEKALAKAREDALQIIEDAKKQAKETEKELVAEAHTQAAAIIARAKT